MAQAGPLDFSRRIQQLRTFDLKIRRRYRLSIPDLVGIDEAGRGPLAGPVVAGAVILHSTRFTTPVDDSKRLSPLVREKAYREILSAADIGVGLIGPEEIDRIGIEQACHQAMLQALQRLRRRPKLALIDGLRIPSGCPVKALPVVHGDAKSLSISCASIVAKVIRDRFMRRAHLIFPEYGFLRHKGYGTPQHMRALRSIGPSFLHRFSFEPLKITSR